MGKLGAVEERYIYSSVTGQKVTTLDPYGAHYRTHIYLGSARIADERNGSVWFNVTDPLSESTRETEETGALPSGDEEETRVELAGLRTSLPLTSPQTMPPPNYSDGGYVGSAEGNCTEPDTQVPIPCDLLARLEIYKSSATPAPENKDVDTIKKGWREYSRAMPLETRVRSGGGDDSCPEGKVPIVDPTSGVTVCVDAPTGEVTVTPDPFDDRFSAEHSGILGFGWRNIKVKTSFGSYVDSGFHPCNYTTYAPVRLATRVIERAIGQDVLADGIKAQVSFLGAQISVGNSRDGNLFFGAGGTPIDVKGFFIDIPRSLKTGTSIAPSISVSGQKILARGNLAEAERDAIYVGEGLSIGGSYKVAAEVEVSSPGTPSTTYIANLGAGSPGVNPGSYSRAWKLPVGTCLQW